jgi:hypothetical protein
MRDGGTTGQLGPVSAKGQRALLVPMGLPVAPLPLPASESPVASPGASTAPDTGRSSP